MMRVPPIGLLFECGNDVALALETDREILMSADHDHDHHHEHRPSEISLRVKAIESLLIEKIATETDLAKRDVKAVIETLAAVGYKELKKIGVFLVPGFAKFVVIKKPATKERQGTNPFTGQEMMFKARPARNVVRARPLKALKDAV